jgi:parvulin-like peptidyl-prolyl isomerase
VAPKAPVKLTRQNVWQVPPQTAVAVVNGEPISVQQWAQRMTLIAGSQAMDSLVQEAIFRQEARKQGIRVTPAEITTRVEQELKGLRARFGSEEQLQEVLNQRKMTLATLREGMRAQLEFRLLQEKLRDKVTADIRVPEADIAAAYEAQKPLFQTPEEARVSHILVSVVGTDPQVDATAKKKAEELLGRAKSLTAEQFADLARENSEDLDTKAKGGELPVLRKATFYGPGFDAAVFAASPGVLPEAVRSFRGFHVVFLHERTPPRVRSLEEVKGQLQEQLLTQRRTEFFQRYVEKLRKGARQEIRLQD